MPSVLVAADAFDATLPAARAAATIARGFEACGLEPPDVCPVSGGGPGTLGVLLPALGGETVGALGGRAAYALVEDGGTALVEPVDGDGRATGDLLGEAARGGAAVVVLCAAGWHPEDPHAVVEALGRPPAGVALVVLLAAPAVLEPPSPVAHALADATGAQLVPGTSFVLDALGFDTRMRAAQAVIVGTGVLDDAQLRGRPFGEAATRARQAGIPCHAVVGEDRTDPFAKRIVDVQRVVVTGMDATALEGAAAQLVEVL